MKESRISCHFGTKYMTVLRIEQILHNFEDQKFANFSNLEQVNFCVTLVMCDFSVNSDLQQQFTVKVKNRLDALDQEETPTENYQRLIDAIDESTEQLVPKAKKSRRSQPSTDPRVEAARTRVNDSCSKY